MHMSVAGRKRSTIGVDHTGRLRRGAVVPADHFKALVTDHMPAVTANAKDTTHAGNIARDGAPKAHIGVPVHNGMATKSRATGDYHFGGDALSRADANPSNPLGGAPRGKNLTAPQASFGQRSRITDSIGGDAPGANHKRGRGVNHQLGRAIMGAALEHADNNTRQAFGIIGTIPDGNVEN